MRTRCRRRDRSSSILQLHRRLRWITIRSRPAKHRNTASRKSSDTTSWVWSSVGWALPPNLPSECIRYFSLGISEVADEKGKETRGGRLFPSKPRTMGVSCTRERHEQLRGYIVSTCG